MDLDDHLLYMSQFLTEERKARFLEVLSKRTRSAVAVLENTVKEQNASAVIRTLDALGFHEVHLVESEWEVKLNSMISKGSDKWLDIRKSTSTIETIRSLKKRGYKIAATTLHEKSVDLKRIPTKEKIAVIFGNEWDGISQEVEEEADLFVQIPMYGFVESYNLSVSVGMVFSYLRWEMESSNYLEYLTEEEKKRIQLRWAIKSSRSGREIYSNWLEENKESDLSGIL